MNWFVYIIKTVNDKLYTGITNDLERRYKMHEEGKGSKFLRANPPQEIVYKEIYQTKSEALKREIQIKKLSRKSKLELIK